MLTLYFLCFLNQTRSSSNRGPVYGLTNQNRVLISRGTNGSIRELDFHIPFWWRHKNCELLVTSLACVGKKTVCKRRPFTRAAGLLVTMSKYFILTCLLFPFVSFIILLALCQYYKRGCFSEEVECWGIVRVRWDYIFYAFYFLFFSEWNGCHWR